MSFRSWLDSFGITTLPERSRRRLADARRHSERQLFVEGLEDRRVFALAAPVNYDAGESPQAIVSADFNHDTIQDLAVANYFSSDVSLLLGNADGTFQPAMTSP